MALSGSEMVGVIAQNGYATARSLSDLKNANTWDSYNVLISGHNGYAGAITVNTLKTTTLASDRWVPRSGGFQVALSASDLNTYFGN